jgi:hypothetical protein
MMARTAWQLRYWIGRAGWAGCAGALLLAASLGLIAWTEGVQVGKITTLRLEADRVQKSARGADAIRRPLDTEGQLQAFYRAMPPMATGPDQLERIHAAAAAHNVRLHSGEYSLVPQRGLAAARYQIALPATGSYTDLRAFVGRVLAEIPSLALEDIALKREAASSRTVEARLKFTLYLAERAQ